MNSRSTISRILFAMPFATLAAQTPKPVARICLAPTSVESVSGNATDAMNAVRDEFTSFLTGPSLGVSPLTARLASQAREEAKAANCSYVLLTTVAHVRKGGGGNGLIAHMAGSAVQQGAYAAGSSMSSTGARIATNAAAGAAGAVAYNYASTVKAKDELTLTTRLESGSGVVLAEKTEKRKAKADAEDLLTPLVQSASEVVAAVVSKASR